MKEHRKIHPQRIAELVTVLAVFGSLFSSGAAAQTGFNAVYNSSGNCSPSSPCAQSAAFIDATVFTSKFQNPDICTVLNFILTPSNHVVTPVGAVIDARGLSAKGTSMSCPSTQPSPWSGITNPPPSTILLPAATINIPATWMLPSNTHLIGEGDSVTSALNTTIEAIAGDFPAGSTMIQFGSSSLCLSACTGISVEQLVLAGQGLSLNGTSSL